MDNLLTANLVEMVVGNAPAVLILLYIAWQQQKMINLVIETCIKRMNDEDDPI